MSSITVRNLSDDVKAALKKRAKASGESLEAFLRRILQAEAAKPVRGEKDWAALIDEIREQVKALPPLKPGEKELQEIIEERRAASEYAGER